MHIRKPAQLNETVRSEACQAWAVKHISEALEAVGYTFKGDISASDLSQKEKVVPKSADGGHGHGHGHGKGKGSASEAGKDKKTSEKGRMLQPRRGGNLRLQRRKLPLTQHWRIKMRKILATLIYMLMQHPLRKTPHS